MPAHRKKVRVLLRVEKMPKIWLKHVIFLTNTCILYGLLKI